MLRRVTQGVEQIERVGASAKNRRIESFPRVILKKRRPNPALSLRAHQTQKFRADLVDAAFVGLAFLMENSGNFRAGFEPCLSLLLNLDVDHFFQ